MTDVVSPAVRSRMMAGIKAKNTKPEMEIRRRLHRMGFRYSLHGKGLPGKPDIVLKKYNAVIFVHGCFWHRHQCVLFKWPKTRTEFWKQKLSKNHLNDEQVLMRLLGDGWRVCTVWECAVKGASADLLAVADEIATWLNTEGNRLEIAR